MNLCAVVMAGGQGRRFWPASTSRCPKQYLALHGGKPLLRETLVRFGALVKPDRRYVVTLKEQEDLARQCSKGESHPEGLIFEPCGRNTAPCILLALAALKARGVTPQDVVALVPSDHVILNDAGFRKTLQDAARLAFDGRKIVTIGIPPTFPHTGYGYIQRGKPMAEGAYAVKSFREKPDLESAKGHIRDGDCYWNAGMFVARVDTWLGEYEHHAQAMFRHFPELCKHAWDLDKVAKIYEKLPTDSIDYAIMEKSAKVAVLPAAFDWNDLGCWEALEELARKREGNAVAAAKGTFFQRASGNIVYAPDKFVAIIGVEDTIVVASDQVVMILPKGRGQVVKEVVAGLDKEKFGDLI